MQIDSKIFSLLGYVILAIGFGIQIKNNFSIETNKLVIFGYIIVIIGYLLNAVNDGLSIFKIKMSEINYGNLLLSLFYLFSFLLDINKERKNYDVLALVGHLLLIKETDKDMNLVGMISLLIYHVQYVIKSFKYSSNSNKIFTSGSSFLSLFFIIKVFGKMFSSNIIKNDQFINL